MKVYRDCEGGGVWESVGVEITTYYMDYKTVTRGISDSEAS